MSDSRHEQDAQTERTCWRTEEKNPEKPHPQEQLNIEFIENVDRNWSVAQKTIETLKRRNISYVALVMDKNDDLLVYKGKGQHSNAETQTIKTHCNLRPLLR